MLNAMIEGHAVFYSERVAARLGLEAAAVDLRRMATESPADRASLAVSALFQRPMRRLPMTYYRVGRDYIASLHAALGVDGVWQRMAAARPSTAALFDVSDTESEATPSARGTPKRDDDPQPILDVLRSWLGETRWNFGGGPVGEAVLRSLAMHGVDDPGFDACLDALAFGVLGEAIGRTDTLAVRAVALRFASPEDATRFLEFDVGSARVDRNTSMEDWVTKTQVEITIGPAPEFEALIEDLDQAWQLVQTPKTFAPRGRIVWVQRGRAVVEVSLLSLQRNDEQIADLVRELLDAIPGG